MAILLVVTLLTSCSQDVCSNGSCRPRWNNPTGAHNPYNLTASTINANKL